jgi:hypothetical protein
MMQEVECERWPAQPGTDFVLGAPCERVCVDAELILGLGGGRPAGRAL